MRVKDTKGSITEVSTIIRLEPGPNSLPGLISAQKYLDKQNPYKDRLFMINLFMTFGPYLNELDQTEIGTINIKK